MVVAGGRWLVGVWSGIHKHPWGLRSVLVRRRDRVRDSDIHGRRNLIVILWFVSIEARGATYSAVSPDSSESQSVESLGYVMVPGLWKGRVPRMAG